MKRFKFRLQKVLDYRSRICEEKRQELGRKNFERDQATEQLENLRNSLRGLRYVESGTESASFSMPGIASGPVVNVHQFVMVANYATRLEKEIEQQMVVVEEAIEAAEKARQVYVEASKDVKALDTLKEKKLVDYNEERLKEEEQALDEMTVQRFKRGTVDPK